MILSGPILLRHSDTGHNVPYLSKRIRHQTSHRYCQSLNFEKTNKHYLDTLAAETEYHISLNVYTIKHSHQTKSLSEDRITAHRDITQSICLQLPKFGKG